MYITVGLEAEKTKELEAYIKAKLPEIINENIFANEDKLRNLVRDCVKGQIKQCINELMQGKYFRDFLRNKIYEYMESYPQAPAIRLPEFDK